MSEGMITVLYKWKGKRQHLKNWHLISFLNVDDKILVKVLANQLKAVIVAIPDAGSQRNLALIKDTVQYVEDRQVSTALVSLDQEKE